MTEDQGHPKDNESLTDQLWRFLNEMVRTIKLTLLGLQGLELVQICGLSHSNACNCRQTLFVDFVVDSRIFDWFQRVEIRAYCLCYYRLNNSSHSVVWPRLALLEQKQPKMARACRRDKEGKVIIAN